MAFSIRKMLSGINYFKKPGENQDVDSPESATKKRRHTTSIVTGEPSSNIVIERTEPDSTSKSCAASLKLPDDVRNFVFKKGSLSDTDLLKSNLGSPNTKKDRRRSKKLRLDIKKANKSMSEALNIRSNSEDANFNLENTPKHISLGCKSSDIFSERLKDFDFHKSFDIFDAMSDGRPATPCEDNFDIESLSEHSDTDVSFNLNMEEKSPIKMCRKVDPSHQSSTSINQNVENRMIRSTTPESFADVELDKNEDERITLLLSYQMKLEKMERFLKQLLTEFQFHIDVSKVFYSKSVVTALPGSDVSSLPKVLGEITYVDSVSRGVSPTGSWNIIMEKEDTQTKLKLKQQLLNMKYFIEEFVNVYLQSREATQEEDEAPAHPARIRQAKKFLNLRSITFDLLKENKIPQKRLRVNNKKKNKRFNDFPDLKEALHNLFILEAEQESNDSNISENITDLTSYNEDNTKCTCKCSYHHISSPSQTDSGLHKEDDISSQSITSSIGNFSLNSSTLTAFSDSLDQIISYNSFQDTSLFSTLLQKPAIERITFYVQVHSIQLKSELNESDFESKNAITFFCPACSLSENEEHGLLSHILSQKHCEKIHFLYKTAYIKKCFSAGKEIQPSTILNPMTMYRDDNKIVCFGDAMYACSLCFENLIIGESILMAHCSDIEHIERREKLAEILE